MGSDLGLTPGCTTMTFTVRRLDPKRNQLVLPILIQMLAKQQRLFAGMGVGREEEDYWK